MPYKNSEKRKEKSRDAARCRRSKETEVFNELSDQLPVPASICSQLDKASIMRLAISYLRINKILKQQENNVNYMKEEDVSQMDRHFPKALNGFVVIISEDGDFVYISESVAQYLGIPQIDLIGQNMYEFIHPCDRKDFTDAVMERPQNSEKEDGGKERAFLVRMKCTLTSKGRNVNLKSASYKVISFTGKVVKVNQDEVKEESDEEDDMEEKRTNSSMNSYFLGIGEPIPHPSNIEVHLDRKTFLTRHNMDMTFTYCDDRMKDLLGYSSSELLGKSIFMYHHAQDNTIVDHAYKDLFTKGQMMTAKYRLLAKQGGFAWVITQATVIYHHRTQKPQCVVCVHYIISEIEETVSLLSVVQSSPVKQEIPPMSFGFNTESVFEPKTKEQTEFYFPPEKKQPENSLDIPDLTHLAPTAGDACIPLSLSEETLLTDDLDISMLVQLVDDEEVKNETPSMMYRNPPLPFSSTTSTPTLSPAQTPRTDTVSKPEFVSMDSFFNLESPDVLSPEDFNMEMRAPYIPMDQNDDYNLLGSTKIDLLNLNEDFNPGIFGQTEFVFTEKDKLFPDPPPKQKFSVRDLQGSATVASIESPTDHFNFRVKRVFDQTSLEKGPPAKISRTQSARQDVIQEGQSGQSSVLLNLLLNGEDRTHGYNLVDRLKSATKAASKQGANANFNRINTGRSIPNVASKHISSKTEQQEAYKAAPFDLLRGENLINALDFDLM